MTIPEALAKLGADLEDGWQAVDHDEERFPSLAAALLERSAIFSEFDREAFFDHVLDPARAGVQHLGPGEAFAQPGITVFHGQGFVVEVYYWREALPAIHNHPFCGVFTVLEGWSVHARYKPGVPARAGDRGQIVDVQLSSLDLIEPGHIEMFSMRRHPLVHALVHIPVPSISLVVRTTRTDGYLRYLPPSIAIPLEPVAEPLARRLAMIEGLVAANDPSAPGRLGRFLDTADFVTVVRLLSTLWPSVEPGDRSTLLEWITELHGDRVEQIAAALNRGLRLGQASAVRMAHTDPDLRFCATALAYAESRNQVLRLLEKRPGDPLVRLHKLADAVFRGPEQGRERALAGALIDGSGVATAESEPSTPESAAAAEQAEPLQHFGTESMFAVLKADA